MTTLDLLLHLYSIYDKITPLDLIENKAQIKKTHKFFIQTLLDQVKSRFGFTAAGNATYTPKQIVSIAYKLLTQTGVFIESCKKQRKHAPALKTA